MKTKFFVGGILAIVLAFSFSCSQKKEEPKPDKDKVKAEIQAIENRFASVFNNRNSDSLTYYADDAVSYFAGLEPIAGIDAIREHMENELMDFPEGAKISFETSEVYVSDDGNVVAEIGAHQLVDSTGSVLQKGHYVSFFKKIDGKYKCTRDMANSVQIGN